MNKCNIQEQINKLQDNDFAIGLLNKAGIAIDEDTGKFTSKGLLQLALGKHRQIEFNAGDADRPHAGALGKTPLTGKSATGSRRINGRNSNFFLKNCGYVNVSD